MYSVINLCSKIIFQSCVFSNFKNLNSVPINYCKLCMKQNFSCASKWMHGTVTHHKKLYHVNLL
jgi:hypothetical protein